MIKGRFLRILFAAAVALLASGTMARENFNNCSRVGTWFGVADLGIRWLGTDTPGPNATGGQMVLEWYMVDPTLGIPDFSMVTSTTAGRGHWQMINHGKYQYSWVAYGLANPMTPVYAVRVSGLVTHTDCDHANITYKLEVFLASQDIATGTPISISYGTAAETRMSMAVIAP